mmetsp:Transcript_128878/g.223519  ORF Transcript_128878/g.223519 Transcript_128878/m.223519 type:complete len:330 (-) Transcript_128878:155-1144(-)
MAVASSRPASASLLTSQRQARLAVEAVRSEEPLSPPSCMADVEPGPPTLAWLMTREIGSQQAVSEVDALLVAAVADVARIQAANAIARSRQWQLTDVELKEEWDWQSEGEDSEEERLRECWARITKHSLEEVAPSPSSEADGKKASSSSRKTWKKSAQAFSLVPEPEQFLLSPPASPANAAQNSGNAESTADRGRAAAQERRLKAAACQSPAASPARRPRTKVKTRPASPAASPGADCGSAKRLLHQSSTSMLLHQNSTSMLSKEARRSPAQVSRSTGSLPSLAGTIPYPSKSSIAARCQKKHSLVAHGERAGIMLETMSRRRGIPELC